MKHLAKDKISIPLEEVVFLMFLAPRGLVDINMLNVFQRINLEIDNGEEKTRSSN